MPPTPRTLEKTATRILNAENDSLGQSLEKHHLLDMLTRCLGLATDFAGYTDLHERSAHPDNPVAVEAVIFIPNILAGTHSFMVADLDDFIISDIADNYNIEFHGAAHGFECIHIFTDARNGTPNSLLGNLRKDILPLEKDIQSACRDGYIAGPARTLVAASREKSIITFRDRQTGLEMSATVSRDSWIQRSEVGLSDESALLLLAEDVDMDPATTGHDIVVLDALPDQSHRQT